MAGLEPFVAVLLPCRNEEVTIGKTVRDFRRVLPAATIYVYDNASSDHTAQVARSAGAIVRHAPVPGKGNVLRRMFAEVDADVYVLADGDDTYDPSAAPEMISRLCHDHLDMVVGRRVVDADTKNAYRPGHQLGNRLLTGSARWVFGNGPRDMLSGYRVFSRRYVKSFPAASRGFEVETEMTIHALELNLPFDEVPTRYGERPGDSRSKLRTIPDGLKILKFITTLCKDYKPLRFFGSLGLVAALLTFSFSGLAGPHVAASNTMAIITGICAGLTMIFVLAGLVLDSLGRSRREMKRMLYLAVSPTATGEPAPSYGLRDGHGVA
jgi:glycosyltransferase involved in cell wall biosynthesis